MNKKIANHVARTAFKAESVLNDLIPLLKSCCDDEYRMSLRAIANSSMAINSEILNKINSDYPEIQEALDEEIEKYGKVL